MIVGSLLFIGFLLFCPEAAISGSKYGCSLWICELIPTLLPFFIALNFFRLQLKKASEHPAEIVGEEVRKLYSWSDEDKLINN